jgi:hypothetical protein
MAATRSLSGRRGALALGAMVSGSIKQIASLMATGGRGSSSVAAHEMNFSWVSPPTAGPPLDRVRRAPESGKTTVLSCCAAELDPALRVVVAEEVFECDVPRPNVDQGACSPGWRGDLVLRPDPAFGGTPVDVPTAERWVACTKRLDR